MVTFLPQLFPACAKAVKISGALLKDISKYLMIVTLFLIGANLSKEKMKEMGIAPVLRGIVRWIVLGSLWCVAIYLGYVKCID